MAITKTAAGNYRVEVFYPQSVRKILGVTVARYRKTFDSLKEARRKERQVNMVIDEAKSNKKAPAKKLNGDISFRDFYVQVFWPMYIAGSTGRTHTIPTKATTDNTASLFKKHLLPLFGDYSINELNEDKNIVINAMLLLSEKYANVRTLKSYVRQMFEVAEVMDYIEYSRLEKPLRLINAPKKDRLKKKRQRAGESLTASELLDWLDAAKTDYENGKLILQDYLLFLLTLNMGDRKSESYALKWKYIDFDEGYLFLIHALDKYGEEKDTKGHKLSKMELPADILAMLLEWKELQKEELEDIGVEQNDEQLIFTYTNFRGGLNQPLHSDYLNYRINSIHHRHPELAHLHPHKLRHTFSTLAHEGGASIEKISEQLTHSDIKTTRIYVNSPDVIDLENHRMFVNRLNREKKRTIK